MSIAEQLEQEEKYEEAYFEYKKSLVHNPNDTEILTRLSHLAIMLEKTDEAVNYLNKIISIDQQNTMAHEQLMSIYEHSDRFKYYIYRGNLNILQSHFTYALNDYKKAIDAAEGDEEKIMTARLVLASIYEQLDKKDKAIDEYIQIIDHGSNEPFPYIKLADLYAQTDYISAAINILEKAQERKIEGVKEILASCYIKASMPEKALEVTEDALTKIRALMDMEENEKAYEELISLSDNDKKNPTFYSLLAQYYYQKELLDEALETVNEYEKLCFNSPLVFQMRALIYEKKENYLQEHVNWAKYNLVRGEKEVAIEEYLNAYQISDKNIQVVEALAFLYDETGDNHKASEFFEHLLELEPKNKVALEKLAKFRDYIGDYEGAIEYMERLQEIDPKNQYVDLNLEKFREKVENPGDILSFFKNLFKGRMG